MEDSSEDNLTTRYLLKGILATEPVRTAVKQKSKKRENPQPSASYVHQDENSSSPAMNLRSKMRERVRRSLGKSTLEASVPKRKVETNSKTQKSKSAKKGSYPTMEDLEDITPRTLLKKIIQNEDEVSMIVPQRPKATAVDKKQENTPTAKLSSVGSVNLSLPDLQEAEHVTVFRKDRKKRKIRVSEFEREVDERLPKNREDEVSVIVSQMPKATAVDKHENTPTEKLSSVGSVNLSLPDLQEAEHVTVFRKDRKKRKMRVSEFEREVDERLPKNRDNISHDNFDVPALLLNSYMSGSIGNKPDTSAAPESTFKRGLLRRPNKICLVSIDDFEQGVEDKYKLLKGSQECFIESTEEDKSDSSSNEIAEKNTELYAQSLRKDANASKLDRKQRGASKPSTFEEIKEANDEFMDTETRTLNVNVHPRLNAQRPEDNTNKDIGGDHGEVSDDSGEDEANDGVEADAASDKAVDGEVSDDSKDEADDYGVESGDDAVEAETDDDADEADYYDDDAVEGEAETDDAVEGKAGDAVEGKAGDAVEAETDDDDVEGETDDAVEGKAGDAVEAETDEDDVEGETDDDAVEDEADDDAAETDDDAVEDESDDDAAEAGDDAVETDDDAVEGMAKKKENKQLMLSPLPETPAYIKLARFGSTDKPSSSKKIQRTKSTKPNKPKSVLSSSQVKQIFTHHSQLRVSKEALVDVEKCLDLYMNQLAIDLSTYTAHARRKTITRADLELLMRRQRLVTDTTSLNVLIEKYLPLDCRALLIPCATSGNKVFPKM